MTSPAAESGDRAPKAFYDLHCHSSASFDSLARPEAIVRAAVARGLTHLAITDHDRIDAALRVRNAAPDDLVVIIGEEIKTVDGDLIAIYLNEVVQPGMTAIETIAAVREQGGLVGVPHPFDGLRGFGRKSGAQLEDIADKIDWIEAYNARVIGGGANEKAALFAREHGLPGICATDSHTVAEVGMAYNAFDGDLDTPDALLAALSRSEMHPGRASYYVRLWTPLAKMIQSARGNGRVRPPVSPGETA